MDNKSSKNGFSNPPIGFLSTSDKTKALLAKKYRALAIELQEFFAALPEGVYDSEECAALSQAQSEFCDMYEELTGKPVF